MIIFHIDHPSSDSRRFACVQDSGRQDSSRSAVLGENFAPNGIRDAQATILMSRQNHVETTSVSCFFSVYRVEPSYILSQQKRQHVSTVIDRTCGPKGAWGARSKRAHEEHGEHEHTVHSAGCHLSSGILHSFESSQIGNKSSKFG